MWDVVWTDPDRELVTQRRAKQHEYAKRELGRASLSSLSSKSSSATSTLGRLRARTFFKQSSNSSYSGLFNMAERNEQDQTTMESTSQQVDGAPAAALPSGTQHAPTEQTVESCHERSIKLPAPCPHSPVPESALVSPRCADFAQRAPESPQSGFGSRSSPQQTLKKDRGGHVEIAYDLTALTDNILRCRVSPSDSVQPLAIPPRSPLRPAPGTPLNDMTVLEPLRVGPSTAPTISDEPPEGQVWGLDQQVSLMRDASPYEALARLKALQIPHANELGDLHEERVRWMFSTLYHLDQIRSLPASDTSVEAGLVVYDSKASTVYLASLFPSKRIFHMSEAPLTSAASPNIQPLYCPRTSASLPLYTNHFSSAYSTRLAAECSQSQLPAVLDCVKMSVQPGGALRLVLIDPIPPTEALGPRLRTWLRTHLLINLDQNARCLTPSTAFPELLANSGLRGPGSTLTTTKFYATTACIAARNDSEGRKVRAELRTLAGCMLWRQTWGEYVTTNSWWWDDAECMQECLELGTYWEYQLIKAVKM